ncbi:hypothetical protein ASD52_33365 [Ensifer sp. Root142]|jgi:hypothetical protein|nr:hypothetical protein ASD00_30315 [Ensifer sp. Root31]KQY68480.1 hypothetical protein ASD52_33365 [Ensifer sp. Root142]
MPQPDPIALGIAMVRLRARQHYGLFYEKGIWELATKTPVPKDRAKIRKAILALNAAEAYPL